MRFLASRLLIGRSALHRSLGTTAANLRYDVVIIGGGPVGWSTALHCAKLGVGRVAVIERDPSFASGSAVYSAGGIRQQFSVPENVQMCLFGMDFLRNAHVSLAVTDEDAPDVQLKRHGYLFLATSDAGKAVLQANNRVQRSCGADGIGLLTREEMTTTFPWLSTADLTAGSHSNDNEGYFDPWAFVSALKRKAQAMGVELVEGSVIGARLQEHSPSTAVIEAVKVRPSARAAAATAGVAAAATQRDFVGGTLLALAPAPFEVKGGIYVNAAGAWAGHIVQLLAADAQRPAAIAAVPVRPRKRCLFTVHCPPSPGRVVPPPTAPLIVDPNGPYFRPEGAEGKFLMGCSPAAADDPDCDPDDADVLCAADHALFDDVIWPTLAARVPAFEQLKVVSSWAGFYDYNTVDHNAIIGPHSELCNLILCCGFSGHGLMQSPAAGRAVAELIASGSRARFETIDLTRFGFDRILGNTPVFESNII